MMEHFRENNADTRGPASLAGRFWSRAAGFVRYATDESLEFLQSFKSSHYEPLHSTRRTLNLIDMDKRKLGLAISEQQNKTINS